jgi:DNA-binding MarR family transcriptional regulator
LLLNRVVAVLVDAAAQEFRAYGLSIPAARAMINLFESGGTATVGSIAETTSIDLSTMSHILRRLEAQGYIRRERQADDNRVVCAVLTATGREVAEKCWEASLRHEAVLVRGMRPKQVELLKQALEQVYANARQGFTNISEAAE